VVAILALIATVILRAQGLGVAGAERRHHIHRRPEPVLFTELLLPFEVTSVLILIAILGAVALARHGHGDPHGIRPQRNGKGRPAK
jgi:NADH-quinone oxidoreductase subunit J